MIDSFKKSKVLLIGDLMVDYYCYGESSRLSPEAPVPVVLISKENIVPGGAANVAINLSSLGVQVYCMGCVGKDFYGNELKKTLKNSAVNIDLIDEIDNYKTTIKQRVILSEQQTIRIDFEENYKFYPSKNSLDLLDKIDFDIVLISDYNKGVISNKWPNFKNFNKIIVDPKKKDFSAYKHSHIITPNISELENAVGRSLLTRKAILDACSELFKKILTDFIIVKRGDKGMIIVSRDESYFVLDAHDVKNPDVTGAGDTVLALFSLVYLNTNDIKISAELANYAASIVVSKKGTSHITKGEMVKLLNKFSIN